MKNTVAGLPSWDCDFDWNMFLFSHDMYCGTCFHIRCCRSYLAAKVVVNQSLPMFSLFIPIQCRSWGVSPTFRYIHVHNSTAWAVHLLFLFHCMIPKLPRSGCKITTQITTQWNNCMLLSCSSRVCFQSHKLICSLSKFTHHEASR